MRTRALVCLAAFAAAAGTCLAQNVYSLNVVGYINVTVPANQYVMIANQLNTTNNTIASLLPTAPDGAILQKFNAGWTGYIYDELSAAWTPDGNATLNPGEGAFFKSPTATTLTFVGEVMQGNLTNSLPSGSYVVRSSMVPQAGTATALAIPGEDGDILQLFSGTKWDAFLYDGLSAAWTPSEPNIGLGQAFFYKKAGTQAQWVRNFTVPQTP